MPRIVDAFAELCSEAKAFEATIGFEIMGSAIINNLPNAITMVETAGAENGGLVLDIYQVANLGMKYEDIRRIPLKYLTNVELNDGTLPGNPAHDPSNRRFCGEGDYDIKGFIDCLKKWDMPGRGEWR